MTLCNLIYSTRITFQIIAFHVLFLGISQDLGLHRKNLQFRGRDKENQMMTNIDSFIPVIPNRLPNFTMSNILKDDEDDFITIWLDWPSAPSLFSVHNLKAFESLLSVYPTAHYRILLPAPDKDKLNIMPNINPYKTKIDNYLSPIHFMKYQKRMYDVEFVHVGKMEKGHTSHIARNYWLKWVSICCTYESDNSNERILPYHVLTFIRLSKMWKNGGIFSDFSFFFLGPTDVPMVTQVKRRLLK